MMSILTIFEGTNETLRLYIALLTQAAGVGRDKIFTPMPQLLRESAGIYEKYTVELAKASDFLLRRYGKLIADRQHALQRVADIAIDLFVGLCVLSRAATLAGTPGENGTQAVAIARVFAQQAKRRMANNIRGRSEMRMQR
jgi:acyl-CoA dehydrogenase family member 9